jgi:hypothetical protein
LFTSELLLHLGFIFSWDSALTLRRIAYNNPFFFWYLILISYRVLIVVNAALNPVLYLWRMQKFRNWIIDSFTLVGLRL